MHLLWAVLFLTGYYPLLLALRSNRNTTLRQPLLWAALAWVAWTGVAWSPVLRLGQDVRLGHYGALCLTGCAGIAVLGARRPGAAAWNFVVVGLLAVMLLPILNGMGELQLEPAQELFLAVTLAVPLLNYLPTRLGPAVVLLASGCALELIELMGVSLPEIARITGLGLLAICPWTAWLALRRRGETRTEFDRLWLAYRDRFGFVWGQRMREQFNRAAHHACWAVQLRWRGLHATSPEAMPSPDESLKLLHAVLKRFGPEEEDAKP
jgi:hypothetical protein